MTPTELTDAMIDAELAICAKMDCPPSQVNWLKFSDHAHENYPDALAALKAARADNAELNGRLAQCYTELYMLLDWRKRAARMHPLLTAQIAAEIAACGKAAP